MKSIFLRFCAVVALSSFAQAATFFVTTAADQFHTPSGASVSLREALRDAAALAGADTIVFAPSLNGATLAVSGPSGGSALTVSDVDGVTVDATSLSGGVKIDGLLQDCRLFTVSFGAKLTLIGPITLTGGGGPIFVSFGGAIYNSGSLTMTGCLLSSNRADGTGGRGGAFYNTGNASLTACTFSGNSANQSGGAIYTVATTGTLTLTQCTVAGNTTAAGSGGGIRSSGGRMNLTHCTISGNTAPTTGAGGVFIGGNSGTITRVQNCIIAGNTYDDVDNFSDAYVPFTSLGHNIVGTGSAIGEFNASGDIHTTFPQLGPLMISGGLTPTMALLPASPARNAAAVLSPAITGDQRGFPVVGLPDIGAYEAGTFTNYNAWAYETLPAGATAPQHAATFDFDGDGQTNNTEWLALTDPGNPNSLFSVAASDISGDQQPYSFASALGRNYTVEYSTDLTAPWQTASGTIVGTGSVINGTIGPVTGYTNYFIRIRVALP